MNEKRLERWKQRIDRASAIGRRRADRFIALYDAMARDVDRSAVGEFEFAELAFAARIFHAREDIARELWADSGRFRTLFHELVESQRIYAEVQRESFKVMDSKNDGVSQ